MANRRSSGKAKQSHHYNNFVSFSEIGGLTDHIRTLKELIIFPLVYQNVYDKFKIRAPRGVLFYGPPGTGKTLLAGALAKECGKEINGKVTFFSRKGADILNKWVGESEEKLRALFAEAAECHPSIIFFDEIDGLAPIRSSKQDQVHASVVATLLALMDGLEKLSGVVVIGATNRIDAIDPALRRPGRFDRELYFPLPAYTARREIIEVHVKTWTMKPKPSFISYLADITVGYSGSDIQALCSEAVMSCLRRNYPDIHNSSKINVRIRNLKVNENDFITARNNIMPSANREANPLRRLSTSIQPLLQRQLDEVILQLRNNSPHFMDQNYKYNIGSRRYSGKLLIVGNPNQGHNTHIAPAILHALEHLPSYVIDIQALYKSATRSAEEICVQKLTQARLNLPSIVLTYRLNEWWDVVEESTRAILVSMLKDVHTGLPLLIIATATNDLPACLADLFGEPGSVVYVMENPNDEERSQYFYQLFMEIALRKCKESMRETRSCKARDTQNYFCEEYTPVHNRAIVRSCSCKVKNRLRNNEKSSEVAESEDPSSGTKRKSEFSEDRPQKQAKISETNLQRQWSDTTVYNSSETQPSTWSPLYNFAQKIRDSITNITKDPSDDGACTQPNHLDKIFVGNSEFPSCSTRKMTNITMLKKGMKKHRNDGQNEIQDLIIPGDSKVSNVERIKYLYRRIVTVTTKNMSVSQLELLHDMLCTCINRKNQDIPTMLENIGSILTDFETKQMDALVQY